MVGIRGFSYKLTTFKHTEGLKLEKLWKDREYLIFMS